MAHGCISFGSINCISLILSTVFLQTGVFVSDGWLDGLPWMAHGTRPPKPPSPPPRTLSYRRPSGRPPVPSPSRRSRAMPSSGQEPPVPSSSSRAMPSPGHQESPMAPVSKQKRRSGLGIRMLQALLVSSSLLAPTSGGFSLKIERAPIHTSALICNSG